MMQYLPAREFAGKEAGSELAIPGNERVQVHADRSTVARLLEDISGQKFQISIHFNDEFPFVGQQSLYTSSKLISNASVVCYLHFLLVWRQSRSTGHASLPTDLRCARYFNNQGRAQLGTRA